jgi:cystathionine gamma-synthase
MNRFALQSKFARAAQSPGTPTWEALEEVVGGLEARKAVAFASGVAGIP